MDASGSCQACAAGKFKTGVGDDATSCTACPAGKLSDAGSTEAAACDKVALATQSIQLYKGETWISFNLQKADAPEPSVQDVFNAQTTSAPWEDGDNIRNQRKSVRFDGALNKWRSWQWDLQTVNSKEMYIVHRAHPAVLNFTGSPIELPLSIFLHAGTNYISCPYRAPVPIKSHMPVREDGLGYIYGDRLTSQGATMMFYGKNIGWLGALSHMDFEPGAGYILEVSNSGTYWFPDAQNGDQGAGGGYHRRRLLTVQSFGVASPTWDEAAPEAWQNLYTDDRLECKINGMYLPWTEIDAQVLLDNTIQNGGVVAAFRGDEICGVSGQPALVPGDDAEIKWFDKSGEPFFRVRCCELEGTAEMPISFKFSLSNDGTKMYDLTFPYTHDPSGRRDGKLVSETNKRTKIGSFDNIPVMTTKTQRRVISTPSTQHVVSASESPVDNTGLIVFLIYFFFVILSLGMCLVCFMFSRNKKLYEDSLARYLPIGQKYGFDAFRQGLHRN